MASQPSTPTVKAMSGMDWQFGDNTSQNGLVVARPVTVTTVSALPDKPSVSIQQS